MKQEIESHITALKEAKDGADMKIIKSRTETLSSSLQKIGEILYKTGEPTQNKPDDGKSPKEAEYEEKKDEEEKK